MMKLVAFAVLFVAFAHCDETLEDETSVSNIDDHKEKRGISLNLGQGQGLEGYSYLGPSSYSRASNYRQGYTPITEYGYDNVNWGAGASNFAGGYQGYNGGYNQPMGSYPYRGGYQQPAYSYQRQYSSPVSTYPLGGIGTVGPYGGAAYGGAYNPGYSNGGYGGFNPASGFNQGNGLNRFGSDGLGFGGAGYQQQGYPHQQQGYY